MNPTIQKALDALTELNSRYDNLIDQHNAVIEAVQQGDSAQIGMAIVQYINASTAVHGQNISAVLAIYESSIKNHR